MAHQRFAFNLDDERRAKIKALARSQNMSVATLMRSAIDQLIDDNPVSADKRTTRRPAQIGVRLTPSEREQVAQHVHALGYESTAAWARSLILKAVADKPMIAREERLQLRRLESQLRKIGTNINQIARNLNIDESNMRPEDSLLFEVRDQVKRTQRALLEFISKTKRRY